MRVVDDATATATANYVRNGLPGNADLGWEHSFCTGWQMGCELLDALGYANETDWGATAVAEPSLPAILPRWDDTCVALLSLGHQIGHFETSVIGQQSYVLIGERFGLGAADVHPDLSILLESLGLTREGAWTEEAPLILWRTWPFEWPRPDFAMDPRLMEAARRAIRSVPNTALRAIDAALARKDAHLQRYLVEWVLFRGWRYPDGWLRLSNDEPRALSIFHDPVASWLAEQLIAWRMIS